MIETNFEICRTKVQNNSVSTIFSLNSKGGKIRKNNAYQIWDKFLETLNNIYFVDPPPPPPSRGCFPSTAKVLLRKWESGKNVWTANWRPSTNRYRHWSENIHFIYREHLESYVNKLMFIQRLKYFDWNYQI